VNTSDSDKRIPLRLSRWLAYSPFPSSVFPSNFVILMTMIMTFHYLFYFLPFVPCLFILFFILSVRFVSADHSSRASPPYCNGERGGGGEGEFTPHQAATSPPPPPSGSCHPPPSRREALHFLDLLLLTQDFQTAGGLPSPL